MKGYIRVRSVAGIEQEIAQLQKRGYDKSEFLLDMLASPESMGWIPLTAAIKQGSVLKVSALKHDTHFDAHFDIAAVTQQSGNGKCEIRGGPLACVGTFVEVTGVAGGPESKMCFVCHSSSGDGRSVLKWEIAVMDFVDADNLPAGD